MQKITIFFLLIFPYLLQGQETFNKRMDFGFPASVLTSIEVNDSCFYVTGVIRDSLFPFGTGNLFAKLNLEGEILSSTKLTDSIQTFETWKNELKPTLDNNFINGGYGVDNIGARVFLLKQNSEGDSLLLRSYRNPFYPSETFITFQGLVENSDTSYLLCNIIYNPDSEAESNQAYILKVDKNGELDWAKRYFVGELNSVFFKALKYEDGYLLAGGINNMNSASNNFEFQSWLLKIDAVGEIEWEYKSSEDELLGFAVDVLVVADGGFIISTTKEIELVSGPNSYLEGSHYIYKINENREFEWGLDIMDTLSSVDNYFWKLIEVNDGSGYLAAGTIFEYTEGFGYNINGILTKVSPSGENLWTRYYNHVDSPADYHVFYDLEETVDGGFVMVGQARDGLTTADPPRQQAWIVKVDESGCLVPGCQLIDAVEEQAIVELSLSLYPNPTTDYLNIFYYHPRHQGEVAYQLIDLQGRVVRSFSSAMNNVTHVVDVGALGAGQYVLRIEIAGEVVARSFVKQ